MSDVQAKINAIGNYGTNYSKLLVCVLKTDYFSESEDIKRSEFIWFVSIILPLLILLSPL